VCSPGRRSSMPSGECDLGPSTALPVHMPWFMSPRYAYARPRLVYASA
jgi:hypothetical protein